MTGYKYNNESPFGEGPQIIRGVAQILQENQVPCMLIGSYMWAQFVEGEGYSIDLVIPDAHIYKAIYLLEKAGFPGSDKFLSYDKCLELDPCQVNFGRDFVPFHQFHLKTTHNSCYHLTLYKQSDSFWTLPKIPLESPANDDPNFMVITDPRLSFFDWNGIWQPSKNPNYRDDPEFKAAMPPVIIPTFPRSCEALMRLAARDFHLDCRRETLLDAARIIAVKVYDVTMAVCPDLNKLERFHEVFRPLWEVLKKCGHNREARMEELARLIVKLEEAGEMPETPTMHLASRE
ncbi:hypothetical protein ASPCADRAFT_407137 [Aspergillus carbonarius ITEM 5010]|uniref:Uncharacterized protein n=1 Tax=Aspergillus carbonarius (strain ITEM 5010) TaxID=602072 RepID=A0A1R3RIU4_ASPC5|nr:hypothetical protein ASPCADRAFT_407137 [Aspergillus carbonarius ITEM 5010]